MLTMRAILSFWKKQGGIIWKQIICSTCSTINVFVDMNHQKTVVPDDILISGWSDLNNCLKRKGVRNG